MSTNLPSRILRIQSIRLGSNHFPPSTLSASRFQCLHKSQTSQFSTTASRYRDNNRVRGLSAMRRSGLRGKRLSISEKELPVPVLDPVKRTRIECDPNHGLWGFFNRDRTLLSTPQEDSEHGRFWTVNELRRKSWDDLHCLWWKCIKEENRLATEQNTRERLKAGYGQYEGESRASVIKETKRAIMHTLTERWYAWEDARSLAVQDPEVQWTKDGVLYQPVGEPIEDSLDVREDDDEVDGSTSDHGEREADTQRRATQSEAGDVNVAHKDEDMSPLKAEQSWQKSEIPPMPDVGGSSSRAPKI